jgi:hypothetical protein
MKSQKKLKSGTRKVKKLASQPLTADILAQRRFNNVLLKAIGWIKHLDPSPKPNVKKDSATDVAYDSALNLLGLLFVKRLINQAKAGDTEAIKKLVRHGHEMTEAIEEIAEKNAVVLMPWARGRADWPVMICRHETSAKPVAAYLDKISLGSACAINADGTRVAKYSLRTPINRFVWRKLKGLRFSIELMSDVPGIARIDLASLPKLTKATAKLWADKALVPYICAMYADFSQVPEFSGILARPGVRTRGQQRREIRKDVIRALQSLAPAS